MIGQAQAPRWQHLGPIRCRRLAPVSLGRAPRPRARHDLREGRPRSAARIGARRADGHGDLERLALPEPVHRRDPSPVQETKRRPTGGTTKSVQPGHPWRLLNRRTRQLPTQNHIQSTATRQHRPLEYGTIAKVALVLLQKIHSRKHIAVIKQSNGELCGMAHSQAEIVCKTEYMSRSPAHP